ncbi:AHH domain-containing protein [Hyunsoonleella pacifica]|uniref:AHH domain-containing protein n=1 Tax=Hyunsoonleella pacifica TaxID=1080224 RepID=UPI0035311F32
MKKTGKKLGDLFQVHHVIPVELLKKNDFVKKAVIDGFDFNGVTNGIPLQSFFRDKRGRKRLSRMHAPYGDYTKNIEKAIEKFVKSKGE